MKVFYGMSKYPIDSKECWTDNEELNTLEVNRLGYRSNTDIILDFVRSGQSLTDFRENGFLDDDDEYEDYFEETSTSVDNLYRTTEKVKNLSNGKNKDVDSAEFCPIDEGATPKQSVASEAIVQNSVSDDTQEKK